MVGEGGKRQTTLHNYWETAQNAVGGNSLSLRTAHKDS